MLSIRDIYERSNLTEDQLILWVGQKLQPDAPIYNVGGFFDIFSEIDPQQFQRAFQTLVNSSDALRTVIEEVDGVPRARVIADFPYSLDCLDFSQAPDPDAKLQAWVDQRHKLLFDFEQCLFDSALIRMSPDRFIWYITQHHIISDALSFGLIFLHMSQLYGEALEGRLKERIALPPYQDYVDYVRNYRDSAEYLEAAAYWEQKLSEELEPLPFYGRPPSKPTTRMQRVSCDLGMERAQRLRSIAAQEGIFLKNMNVTLFNVFAALLSTYLYRISGSRHLSLGISHHNRHSPAFKSTIGLFVRTYPLRVTIDEDETFLSLIRKVANEASETLKHRQYPVPNPLHSPVFDVALNYQIVQFPRFHGAPLEVVRASAGHGNQSLVVEVNDFGSSGTFVLTFDFHGDVFDEEQQKRATRQFLQLIDSFLEDSTQSVRQADLLPDEERQRLLVELNQTAAPFPEDRTIAQLFQAQAQRRPDQLAVVFEDESLTYAQLNARANQLARHLQALGVGPERLVGICVDRSPEMVVGLMGILKAGGAYLPLDPTYPQGRLAFILEDAQVSVLLTQQRLVDRLPKHDAHVICLDTDWEAIALESEEDFDSRVTGDNLAYVIYTSGSTGRPKGVQIQHRSLVNHSNSGCRESGIEPSDRVLQFLAIGFDAAAEEIYPCLVGGATLVLRTDAMLTSVRTYLQKCRDLGVTVAVLPTPFWHHVASELSDNGLQLPEQLRLLIFGGERALPEKLRAWQSAVGHRVRLVNAYGPTEATIVTTKCELTRLTEVDPSGREVPIGRPVQNVQVYLLDPHLRPVPIGVPGELYVGGVHVARGYLNRPALTAESFIPDPFSDEPGARLYKTGDLARYLPDGNIEFLGRIDQQVKVRGFRIELGEIETVLGEHPLVRETAVVVREDTPEDKRLVAYVVSDHEERPSSRELRRFLRERLPGYMVPSAFVMLEALPLTPHGKVDRLTLPKPDLGRVELEEDFVSPRNEVEARLAQIWEELLETHPIGVRDDFFELGGHSLLAVRVTTQIEEVFGTNIPLTTFFRRPTIEQLAEIVGQETGLATWPTLVEIQPQGTRPPFFCVHPLCGDVVGYANWAGHLGPDQPFYGLRARGLDGVQEPLTQVEEIAADYVTEVRSIQSEGPYYIGGYGGGGAIAFEMAQQLSAQGQKVAFLAIVNDAPPNSGYYTARGGARFVVDFLKNLPYWLYEFLRFRLAQVVLHLQLQLRPAGILGRIEQKVKLPKTILAFKERLEKRGRELLDEHNRALLDHDNVPRVHDERQRRIAMLHYTALLNYVPQFYPGRITAFRTNRQPLICSFDPELGWGELASEGVDARQIPGSTATLLREPYARAFAQQLGACLDEAQASVGSTETYPALVEQDQLTAR